MPDLIDTSTALETLQKLPLAMAILEDERIIWANQLLIDLSGLNSEQVIGQSPFMSEHTLLQYLFSESGEVHCVDMAVRKHYFRPEVIHLLSSKQVVVFHDVSREKALEQQVELYSPKDSNTGLYNRRNILENLASQVTRSRRYGNPLALLRLTISGCESDIPTRMKSVAEQLKDRLRWADCLGTLNDNTHQVILPETCLEEAKELAAKLLSDRAIASDGCTIQFGITAWQKGDDPARMLSNIDVDQDVSTMALFSD